MKREVMIPINPVPLKAAIVEKGQSVSAIADSMKISRQAVNAWLVEERIPPRRLSDLAQLLDLSVEQVERICDKEESAKDYAREVRKLRDENHKLKQAVAALIGDFPASGTEGERHD